MAHLHRRIVLPRALDEVFAYFADAGNLQELTPPWLHFHILTPAVTMAVGARIDYRLRLRGVPIRWQSEITVWEPGRRFVDEQRRGPYRRWVHEHRFAAVAGGTEVIDDVDYRVPGGGLVDRLLVRRELRRIFDYRHARLQSRFGELHG